MKRVVFGVALMLALLFGGVLAQNRMASIHGYGADLLSQAGREAQKQEWDAAQMLFYRARRSWKNNYHFTAALADHTPMEDVEALYTQLEVFAEMKEDAHFAALCMETASRLEAIADAHVLAWWNVL